MTCKPALVIASLVLSGCGARSTLDDSGRCVVEGCDTPRVADCTRRTPEATPLAVMRVSNVRFTADDDALYFRSENRIHRLPFAAGKAVAVTPEPAGDPATSYRGFDARDGLLAWFDGSTLRTMAVGAGGGGDVQTLAELPEGQKRVIIAPGYAVTVDDALGLDDPPVPVYRVPLAGGPPEVLIPGARVTGATRDDATGQVLLSTRDGLLAVDASTGVVAKLSDEGSSPFDPAAAGGAVFHVELAPSINPSPGPNPIFDGIFRVAPGQPAQEIARGRFLSIAADADDVVFDGLASDVALGAGQMNIGVVPRDGGPPEILATSDSKLLNQWRGPLSSNSTTVRTDGKYVYFAQVCLETENTLAREFRLVRLPKRRAE